MLLAKMNKDQREGGRRRRCNNNNQKQQQQMQQKLKQRIRKIGEVIIGSIGPFDNNNTAANFEK